MIGLSFFVLSFLCAQPLDAAEASTSTQKSCRWEQPVIGTQAEFNVISKFNAVTLDNDHFSQITIRDLLVSQYKSIIKEKIKEHIEEHVSIIKNSGIENYYGHKINTVLPTLMAQSFLDYYWRKKPEKYENCDIPAPTLDYDEQVPRDLDKLYGAGVVSRVLLHAQLYNEISKYDSKERYQFSALHVELLFDICAEIAAEIKTRKIVITGNLGGPSPVANFLNCRKSWFTDKERVLIRGDDLKMTPIVSPAGSYDIAYKENTIASFPPYCVDEKETVSGARQVVKGEQISDNATDGYQFHFYNQLNSYHALYRSMPVDFEDLRAHAKFSWVDQRVCLICDTTFGESRISKIIFPPLHETRYSVRLRSENNKESSLAAQVDAERGVVVNNNEIKAFAYDKSTETILYADGVETKLKGVKKNRVNSLYEGNVQKIIPKAPIKKIIVIAGGVYMVLNQNGIVYYDTHADDAMRSPQELELGLKDIIDIAFDEISEQLVFLTASGVYTASCRKIESKGKATQKFRALLEHTPRASSEWNIDQTAVFVENKNFNYSKHQYDSIEFQNGQIYAIRKPTNGKNGHVLIYPPLSAAAAPIDQASSSSSSSRSGVSLQLTETVPTDLATTNQTTQTDRELRY